MKLHDIATKISSKETVFITVDSILNLLTNTASSLQILMDCSDWAHQPVCRINVSLSSLFLNALHLFFSDKLSFKISYLYVSSSTIMLTHNSPRTKCVYFILCTLYVLYMWRQFHSCNSDSYCSERLIDWLIALEAISKYYQPWWQWWLPI